jgi:N6-L-threonylcarbamoyladenine synthase
VSTLVLAIETSCDDTSVSIVDNQLKVLSVVSQSQDEFHQKYGGVVPEIASRSHAEVLLPLVDLALDKAGFAIEEMDFFASTNRPGLLGSLLVGTTVAKTLSIRYKKPWMGINHLEGHILAPFAHDDQLSLNSDFKFPYLSMAVSGGHSSFFFVNDVADYTILGHTVDDAAGEALDKFAKMLGLGWPGGAIIDRLSQGGNPEAFLFPRSMIKEANAMLSFSGLKSSAQRLISDLKQTSSQLNETQIKDLCASFLQAVVDVLISKLEFCIEKTSAKTISVTGGVSANTKLRLEAQQLAGRKKTILQIPPLRYCTDNAAMIGVTAMLRHQKGLFSSFDQSVSSSPYESDFKVSLL